jgi:DNA-binding MarR family transcriptional regulator
MTMDARPEASGTTRNLTALKQTPGFLVRIVQIQIFEAFYRFFDELGLTPAQHTILIVVRDNPSITQSELAGILRIQLPNLVKLLGQFERDGVIRRTRSKRDRRAVELRLTARGTELAKQTTRLADEFNEQTLSPLRPGDRAKFMQMLVLLSDPHPVARD